MAFIKRDKIVEKVLNELALVTGSSVQIYNEPIINDYIQRSFDHLFKKRFWDHLTLTTYHVLDGADGVVTDEILDIEDLTDIKWVRKTPFEPCDEIPYHSDGLFNSNDLAYRPIVWTEENYANKRIKFNPITSTENIAIRARRMPKEFSNEDVIPFDHLCMIHLTTASVLAIDGMNPSAEARQNTFFEDRYDTIVSNEADKAITSTRSRFSSEFTVAP